MRREMAVANANMGFNPFWRGIQSPSGDNGRIVDWIAGKIAPGT
tara:strand:+ start:159531 stop:159662 length:132 start_codon:yes stop_codon:yes gene_type:complete